jgi:hypothetical protein
MCLAAGVAAAEEPHALASRAFDSYAAQAREHFLRHDPPTGRNEQPQLRPGSAEGIVEVPGGLIHHWVAAAFIRGATLRQALEISFAFKDYPRIYRSVIASSVQSEERDAFRVTLRVREGLLGAHVILDVRSRVEHLRAGARGSRIVSGDEEIREVENAGAAGERRLPRGADSGYLWRSGTLTSLAEDDEGVYVEIQTLGLSRDYPALIRWLVDPVARHVGRKSAGDSLQDFRAALLGRQPR